MQTPSLPFCQNCGKRFPAVHQFKFCDECGQPTGSFQSAPHMVNPVMPPDDSSGGGNNALTILILGFLFIVAIALIIFVALKVFSGDSSETSSINLPTTQIIGLDVEGPPAKVNYLILRISNPASGEAFSISNSDLIVIYEDSSQNLEEVSYPSPGTGAGFISSASDQGSINACSSLAKQPGNIAIWCVLNNGMNTSILPGMSADIYVFLGGLANPLIENMEFAVELIAPTVSITANGVTPSVFQLPGNAHNTHDDPTPTPEPTKAPISTPVSPTATPGFLLPTPESISVLPPATPKPSSPAVPTPSLPVQPIPTSTPEPVNLLPLPPVSSQIQPHVFVGVARIGGQIAPIGTKVSVWVSGYASAIGTADVTGTGSFVLLAKQHGSILVSSQTSLSFRIGDKITSETSVWELGGATAKDLQIN